MPVLFLSVAGISDSPAISHVPPEFKNPEDSIDPFYGAIVGQTGLWPNSRV
jgi:hypothetical protein